MSKFELPTVSVNLNDAAFLSKILEKWMNENDMNTAYLQDLAKHLSPSIDC